MRLAKLETALKARFIERDEEIECALLALLCKEHVFFEGVPGTGKSQLLRYLCQGIEGACFFELLMMKETERNEIVGNIDMDLIQSQQKWQREMTGFLPTAHIGFIDEIWNASSSAYNSILGVMQERKVRDFKREVHCPLHTLVAASNQWPIGEDYKEAAAAFDRFLFRKTVKPISPAEKERLLFGDLPEMTPQITLKDLEYAQKEAMALIYSDSAKVALLRIMEELREEGIYVSDRRARKAVKVGKAAAYMAGASQVEPIHLEPLQHVLWDEPTEQPAKCAQVVSRISNPIGTEITGIISEVEEIIKDAFREQEPKEDANTYAGFQLTNCKKLKECSQRLNALNGNGRAVKAREYVEKKLYDLRDKTYGA